MDSLPFFRDSSWTLRIGNDVVVSWPVLLWVLPLVLTSVGIGVYLGYCLRKQQENWRVTSERRRMLKILAKLVASTDQLSHDVDSHSTELRDVEQRIVGMPAGKDLEAFQQQLVGQIERALASNKRLEQDLICSRYVMEAQAAELDRTRREARTDTLSGVSNRKAFDEYLEYAVAQFKRTGETFGLLLCDVDHFKWINDTHGHPAGDRVVARLGSALRAIVRPGDFVARFGGDEFAVLLMNISEANGVAACERIRRAIENHNFDVGADGSRVAVTFSMGLATPVEGDSPQDILQRADQALYRAKHCGRNQVQVASANEQGQLHSASQEADRGSPADTRRASITEANRSSTVDEGRLRTADTGRSKTGDAGRANAAQQGQANARRAASAAVPKPDGSASSPPSPSPSNASSMLVGQRQPPRRQAPPGPAAPATRARPLLAPGSSVFVRPVKPRPSQPSPGQERR